MSDFPPKLAAALAGRYRLDRRLGEGGMATVYLAEDLKHDRKVAIKVLRPELAAVIGGERFISEIKTTAALQHPHILPLFDSGHAEGFLYYVMPYVEGESLRDLLDREKQLPVDDAVRMTRAVAGALHYAHEQDIVHRDIKPANILLHAGEPQVADFGIAIAISAAGGGRLTETGMSVGTPHYMSPEQATADRDVTSRSDVYSLASVLYEMLAGDPPHTGSSAQAVLVRILTEEPRDVGRVRRSVPPHVAAALRKGLEKLPADRFESAKAFADALGDPAFRYERAAEPASLRRAAAPSEPERGGGGTDWRLVAALVVAAVMSGVELIRGGAESDPPGPVTRLTLDLDGVVPNQPAVVEISPDGRYFAIGGTRDGESGIFLRGSDEESFRLVAGAEGGFMPFFSPDGASLGFVTPAGELQRVAVTGGGARTMLAASEAIPLFPVWGPDGRIFFSDAIQFQGQAGNVHVVPSGGGEAEMVLERPNPLANVWPLRDGGGFLVSEMNGTGLLGVRAGADSVVVIVPGALAGRELPGGDLLYVDLEGQAWRAGFDADALELVGDPSPVLQGIHVAAGMVPSLRITRNGTLVYGTGGGVVGRNSPQNLVIAGFDGTETVVPIDARAYRNVRWSPDGGSIAFSALEPGVVRGRTSLYVYDVALRTATRRLSEDGLQGWPVWSPDGDRILFAHDPNGGSATPAGLGSAPGADLHVIGSDGDDEAELVSLPGQEIPYAWTADGRIVFTAGDPGSSDLTVADAETGAVSTYLDIDGDLGAVDISPDGRFAAYASTESGTLEINVRTFPAPGPPIRVSETGGDRPRWSRDGSAIYYWIRHEGTGGGGDDPTAVDSLVAARVERDPEFRLVSREVVLTGRFDGDTWDLHPDGDRIVVGRSVGSTDQEAGAGQIRVSVVIDWLQAIAADDGGS